MPRVVAKKEAVSKDERLKRKNPHPVRNFFQRLNETQQKCGFCGWVTRENATRMERHIAYSCPSAHEMVRGMMLNMKEQAIERERNSSLTEHNKKDVHCYFATVENDRKRQCIFCEWRTTPNLTRMRKHIAIVCTLVPVEIRALFLKGDGEGEGEGEDDEDYDSSTYRIVDVLEDGERKDFEIVSSAQLQDYEAIELGSEVQLASDPADDGNEYYQLDVDYREHAEETTQLDEAIQAKEKTSRKPKIERNELDDVNEDEDEDHTRGDGDDGMGSDENNLEYLEPQEQSCSGCHQTLNIRDVAVLTRSGKVYCSSACSLQKRGGDRAADKSEPDPKRPVKAVSSTPL
ncbi:uncharacterized protein LOC131215732, partial [Anopheles bellator]|uniref:uncharacterized protein LOC131215732 n=1 Tax=Anopheles bellator TaxID=139047 RepID=UPI002647E78C